MRLLLSGDWHVGAATWGVDRSEEIRSALDQIVDRAERTRPDVVALLGDLFDRFRYPGDGPVRLVASTVRRLLDLPGRPHVIALRGNHDWSGVKIWEILSGEGRLHVVDEPVGLDVAGAHFACLPYLRPHQIPPGGIEEIVAPLVVPGGRDCWSFLLAHMAVEGTVPGLREVTLPLSLVEGGPFNALFCGHIHRHGAVAEGSRAFYTGSPYRVDFSQEGGEVGLFDVDDGVIRTLPLHARELVTLRYDDEETARTGLEEDLRGHEESWVRVALERSSLSRALLLERFRALRGGERIVQLRLQTVVREEGQSPPLEFDVDALWRRFVETEEADLPTRELLTRAGAALLAGKEPEEVWHLLKGRSEGLP